MGWRERWRFILRAARSTPVEPLARFSTTIAPVGVDEYLRVQMAGLGSLGPVPSRELALQVPAVLRGRNLICSLATLPLVQTDAQHVRSTSPLLTQIDPNVPNLVTLAQTFEDLLMDGLSWWRVLARGWDDFPTSAQHLDLTSVSLEPPAGWRDQHLPSGIDPDSVVWVDGKPVNGARELIRFDSPNPGILHVARRAIRRAAKLDMAAERYADDPKALEYFTPAEGADPAEDEEIAELLAEWTQARRDRAPAYVPASLNHHEINWMSPADLQLVALQQRVALDIANAIGLDPEDLGISTTSRTYQNATDRRRDRINDVLSVYMQAVAGRLSMNDVTKRGYRVQHDLTEYLRADPLTLSQVEQAHLEMGTMTREEIRDEQGRPPLPAGSEAAGDSQGGDNVAQSQSNVLPIRAAFAAGDGGGGNAPGRGEVRVSFAHTDVAVERFRVDAEQRTIRGLAVPYNVWASNGWARWKFLPGSLSWSAPARVKFLLEHYPSNTLGVATELTDTDAGLEAAFRVGKGAKRDEALADAADGILDGLSIGPVIEEFAWDKAEEGYVVSKATLREISLCSIPAFDDARLTSVAASWNGGTMPCPLCSGNHVAGAPCGGSAPADAQMTGQAAPPAPAPAAPAPFDAAAFAASMRTEMAAAMAAAMREAFAQAPPGAFAPAAAVEGPAFVNPRQPGSGATATAQLSVREPLPYRFAQTDKGTAFAAGDFTFSQDLLMMAQAGDTNGQTDAGRRVMDLLLQTFATVASGDVDELNPTINQPSKYVDQQDYKYPLWEFVNDGGLPNGVQPFSFPKFSSASGLVGDHTQGTEPTGGSFVTTSQTITPTPVSGKASITREVWEMGGNPQTSTLIWRQMVRSWREALENATATFLNTLTAATDILITTAAVDDVLADLWEAAVADLQFIRGYDFRAFAVEKVLYKTFVSARAGGTGESLYPIINPQNRNGQASSRFRQLDLAGVTGTPSWALPSTAGAANNSWLFDPMFVHGWASPPVRLEFPGTASTAAYAPVAMVDVAIWGYKAFANSDINAVRQVIYDSVV